MSGRDGWKDVVAALRRRVEEDEGFYEEDEPLDKILTMWERGSKGVTQRPAGSSPKKT
jgi:hypothetical protein